MAPEAHRRAEYAEMRAQFSEQREAAVAAQAAQLQALVIVQQMMLQQAQARAQALAHAQIVPNPSVPAAIAQPVYEAPRAFPTPRPLLDVTGAPLAATGYGPAGDIVARVEAYMGRPLTGQERMALGQLLRRPRAVDASDPWLRLQ